MAWIIRLLIVVTFCSSLLVVAEKPRAKLNAILNQAAVLTINGQQHMLRLDQKSPQGYQLTKIAEDYVVLSVNGQEHQIKLGAAVGSYQANTVNRVQIPRTNGMYYVDGRINGTAVQFLVDTGATTVALNSNVAQQAGIDYRARGIQSIANTAAGQVLTWRLNLERVSVGGIEMANVDAAVIEGDYPRYVLLGNSFLSRLTMQDNGLLLTLEQSR